MYQVHNLGHHLHLGGAAAVCGNASQLGVEEIQQFSVEASQSGV